MKTLAKKELIIGSCVIGALAILFFGIDYLKGINLFKPANFYYVEYENVSGLEVAAPVTIQGYKVGQVREIDFPYDKPGKIKVLLALDRNLHLTSDSYATIESGLISGASVGIHQGTSKKLIPVGGTIRGVSSGDLMAALSSDLMPKVNSILPKVDSLLYSLNLLVSDPALLASIQRFDGITANLLATSAGLNTTMNGDVPQIMHSANGVMANMGRITTNVDTITRDLTVLSYQLKTLPLQPTMENVQAVTANLEHFSAQLNNPNSTLGMLMNDPELYKRLNTISADVDSLIVDIKKNPKRYISIKLL